MQPKVSVIVAMRNCEGAVRGCLDALLRQTMRDFEVLCVDGGSTDGTAAVCLEYAARDPRVKILRLGNCRLDLMRRAGEFNTFGEYRLHLDSKRILAPGFLAKFVLRPPPPPYRPPLSSRALLKARRAIAFLKRRGRRLALKLHLARPGKLPPAPPATVAEGKSVRIVNPVRCTGCGACANKCPKGAISMKPSDEGFLFPEVDAGKCVDCGLCLQACPCVKPPPLHPVPPAYAAMADDATRAVSSSGGMVSLLARDVFARGGAVYGAAWAEGGWERVVFVRATDEDGLARIRGSKYLQSETGLAYRDAKKDLDAGLPVLFTGCPCQIAGLYAFLGGDRENLLTADIVCHGANPPPAWKSFLDEFAAGRTLTGVNFRDKKPFGWGSQAVISTVDGLVAVRAEASAWYHAFLKGCMNRECCYTCRYAGDRRVGDVSLGDFWGCRLIDSSLSDRKGTSLVLVNSQRGEAAMSRLCGTMRLWRAAPLSKAKLKNGRLVRPTRRLPGRELFFNELGKSGFHVAAAKAMEAKGRR